MSEAQSSAAENTTPSSPTPVAPKPAKPPMCSLCRVSKTEEHVASGWHAFNEKLFASGRMPIPETNYNLFEKPREDAAKAQASTSTSTSTSSSSPSPVSPAPVAAAEGKVSYAPGQTALAANKRNVNAWHWEESDYTPWAKKIITDNLKSISIPVPGGGLITITDVTKLSGDAYVNTRKGKTFSGYEFKITIEWKGELNGFSDKGKCHLPEVSADNNLEFEITNIKLDGPEGAEKEALLKTFRSAGRKAITTALEMFHDSLTQLAKDPSSFKPPTDGEKDATAASGKNDDD